jgi:hypothetical protein
MIEYLLQAEADVAKNELRARNRRDQIKSRDLQTEEQKNYYREQNKNRHKLIKQRETEEQRIKRINHAKELRKLALARETPEQRQHRLEKVQQNRALKNKNKKDGAQSKRGYTKISKSDTSTDTNKDFIKPNFFPSNNSNKAADTSNDLIKPSISTDTINDYIKSKSFASDNYNIDNNNMNLGFSTLSHSINYDEKDDENNASDTDDNKCLAAVLLSISTKKARME